MLIYVMPQPSAFLGSVINTTGAMKHIQCFTLLHNSGQHVCRCQVSCF